MAIALPVFEHPWLHLSLRLAAALLIAGVLATAVAFTVQSWAQQQLSATRTALILALEPVFAFLTSYLFYGERLSARASLAHCSSWAASRSRSCCHLGPTPRRMRRLLSES